MNTKKYQKFFSDAKRKELEKTYTKEFIDEMDNYLSRRSKTDHDQEARDIREFGAECRVVNGKIIQIK